MLKYIFAFIISLGILLVPYYKPIIIYACTGQEMFPTYYGCPFIYKGTNLGTSLAWDFFVWPTIANLILWAALLLLLRLIIHKTILKNENKIVKYFYMTIKFTVTIYFLFWIAISLKYEGYSLASHINFENEAKTWGMTCEGHISFTEYENHN